MAEADTPQIPHFMPGGLGSLNKMTDAEEAEILYKMSKYIDEMEPEFQDRFKALFSIQSIVHNLDDEEQKGIRDLEVEFEAKYRQVYARRELVTSGTGDLEADLIKEFDERAVQMKDADYDKIEVVPCDVKGLQNCPKGVSDFWVKAMLNHPVGDMITEKDRPILGYLSNIELNLHSEDEGYDLVFTFLPNSYFVGTEIKKTLNMKDKGMLDSTTSTSISWKDGCNPTVKKQKKKKKGKKVTVEVKCESFFNFFNDILPDQDDSAPQNEKDDEGDEEPEDGVQDKLADDMDLSDQFKDDLVPLALEYYLGVIEIDDQEGGEGDDDDSDGGGHVHGANCKHGKDEDDDDEDKPKKGGKKGKKGGGGAQPEMPLGPDGKPQECKQQ